MNTSQAPFSFFTVAHLTRIGNESAGTLSELLPGLEHCSDDCIFHHTFQTPRSHHFLTHTGLLSPSIEGTAYQIRFPLSHPEIAAKLGEQGRQHLKENFLITGELKRYLTLFLILAIALIARTFQR